MVLSQNVNKFITLIGLAAIIFLLIKAFAGEALSNAQTLMLLVFIMIPVLFVCYQNKSQCKITEPYQVTDPPVTSSIYPGPPNRDPVLGRVQIPPPIPSANDDLDVQDYKDILPINKEIYADLVDNEEIAKNKIRQTYTNEMVFTESHPFNTVPLGTQMYGYTFLPPENWFRAYDRPPVCISNERPLMEPIVDGNSTRDLLEFDTFGNVQTARPITHRVVNSNTVRPRVFPSGKVSDRPTEAGPM